MRDASSAATTQNDAHGLAAQAARESCEVTHVIGSVRSRRNARRIVACVSLETALYSILQLLERNDRCGVVE